MAPSIIKIVFTTDLPIGAQLGFDVNNDGGQWGNPTSYSLVFNWVNLRSSNNQVTAGSPTLIPGERSAINFQTAFNLDIGQYIVTRVNNEVTIRSENNFSLTEFYVNGVFAPYINHPSLDFEISNGTTNPFTIDTVSFSNSSTDQCKNVKVNITTSELATIIVSPFVLNGNTNNPFSFDFLRGQSIFLDIENQEGIQVTKLITSPPVLNELNFSIQINNSPNGATVFVNNNLASGLFLQYSLDNITWQNSNIFNGLPVQNYTLYVKDQFGCSFQKTFEVSEFGVYDPYFYISKSNSFRFAKRINFGNSSNYKNDENTLGSEVDVNLAYSGTQSFKASNVITTQFKSNYSNNVVKIIKENLSELIIPVEKKTSNIGIKDKRDALKYNLGNGKTGIYFLDGNLYDFNTNVVIGPYLLNGLLPEWAVIGSYISIDNVWFLVENIIYDEAKKVDVLVISNTYNGSDSSIVVSCIYNDFNYEVYEFTVGMTNFLNETIQIKIESTDSRFGSITHISEKIDVELNFNKHLEIYYWNDDNTDIFYASGIRHLINVEVTKQEGVTEEESEAYKTDTTAILLSAQLYELDKFIFEPVSKEIWRKLMIALSHKNVFINGVQYVKNGNFESEGPLDNSNLYVLTATMLKTGMVYNATSNNDFILSNENSQIQVPGLIKTEIGFLKY